MLVIGSALGPIAVGDQHLFVHGLGYVGLRMGVRALEAGWRVSGTCRTPEKAEAIQQSAAGIGVHVFDLDREYSGLEQGGLRALATATHVLATVPPVADFDRDPLLALHREQLLASCPLRWAGYLSTTGVYGDHGGGWVDEASATRARAGSRAHHRLRAEDDWLSLLDASQGRVSPHVFRLAGVYGPGRSALTTVARAGARVRGGRAQGAPGASVELESALVTLAKPAEARYVSRIHVDDICSALYSSMVLMAPSGEPGGQSGPANPCQPGRADPAASPDAAATTSGALASTTVPATAVAAGAAATAGEAGAAGAAVAAGFAMAAGAATVRGSEDSGSLSAAASEERTGRIFNLADELPAPRGEVQASIHARMHTRKRTRAKAHARAHAAQYAYAGHMYHTMAKLLGLT